MVENTMPYTKALYDIALEDGKEEEFLEELKELNEATRDEKDYLAAMNHPNIPREQKKEWIDSFFSSSLDPLLVQFLKVLAEYNLAGRTSDVYKDYLDLYRQKHQIETVSVESASPLSDKQEAALIEMLKKKLNKNIELSVTVDPSLLAGMRVKANNFVLDNTMSSRLDRLKEDLSR